VESRPDARRCRHLGRDAGRHRIAVSRIEWKADLDRETAAGLSLGADAGVVGRGDRPYDRQAEAVVAVSSCGAVGAESLEGFEQSPDLGRRNDRSSVADREARMPVPNAGADPNAAAREVVADRVVDQVADETFGQRRVARRRGGFDLGVDPRVTELRVGFEQDRVGDLGKVEGLATVEAALARGERQQRLQEALLILAERE